MVADNGLGQMQIGIRAILVVTIAALVLLVGIYMALQKRGISTSSELSTVLTELGFVELRPPSTLFAPGTWVEVRSKNPLHLGIICNPVDALGLLDKGKPSPSVDVALKSRLNSNFALSSDAVSAWKADARLKVVRSVTFRLSNVQLLEIADNVIFEGFRRRTALCKQAIEFRLSRSNPVSMIKSILLADVEYIIDFDGNIGSELKMEATRALEAKLGATTTIDQFKNIRMAGTSLVWGVHDDSEIARFGYGLPPTGNSGAKRSILSGQGPITEIDFSVK